MPSDLYKQAIREAMVSNPSGVVVLHTLTVDHSTVTDPFRIVQDTQEHDLTLENGDTVTFAPVPFRFVLPRSSSNGLTELTIEIDNVDRSVSNFVKNLSGTAEAVEVTYRPYLSNDTTGPQLDPPLKLFMRDITMTAQSVRGRAAIADVVNRAFPAVYYTFTGYPGLR